MSALRPLSAPANWPFPLCVTYISQIKYVISGTAHSKSFPSIRTSFSMKVLPSPRSPKPET